MFQFKGEDPILAKRFTRRALLLAAGQVAGFALLGQHLYQLQVRQQAKYGPLAEENRVSLQLLAPERGRIVDRFGEVLASSRPSLRVQIVPDLAGNLSEVLERLSRIVTLLDDDKERVLLRAKKQSRSLPILIASDLTWEQFAQINLMAPELPGVASEVAALRQYFHGRTMGHIVGYVGQIERVAPDDDPVLRLPGMRIGKVGIERGLEERLRGERGVAKLEVDARGRIIRNLGTVPAKRGADVILTLDTKLQERVMTRLSRERRGAVVAIHIASGDVVAMASVPSYDTAEVAAGMNEAQWAELQNSPDEPLTNRAIRGQYPPGSTYKMVTALAGLEAGVITPYSRVTCNGKYHLAQSTFRCWNRSGHGSVNLHRALRESCDCYFYETANRLGIERLAEMARRLGFGQLYGACGLPLQKAGLVPDPDWKMGHLSKAWLGGETVLAGIGQGYVLATPFQLAVMTARLASGRKVVPRLVRSEGDAGEPQFGGLGIKPGYLEAVRRGMAAVVNEEAGTGHTARLEFEGIKLAGKTGTAQVSRASTDRDWKDLAWHDRDHALFVGFAPVGQPRYAVAAIVEHGGGGSISAAPLVRDVMTEILIRDPVGRPPVAVGISGASEPGIARGGRRG